MDQKSAMKQHQNDGLGGLIDILSEIYQHVRFWPPAEAGGLESYPEGELVLTSLQNMRSRDSVEYVLVSGWLKP